MSGQLVHLDLFSGVGGFSLACQWAGIETIGFVENDKYCQKVLRKHWPQIPIVEDIRDVEEITRIVANASHTRPPCTGPRTQYEGQERQPGHKGGEAVANAAGEGLQGGQAEQCDGDSREWHEMGQGLVSGHSVPGGRRGNDSDPAILITAGFPCQPFSVAGKRGSKGDDRYLWPETLAVIKAVKPKWVLLENVAGIIPLALDDVLSDLEGAGYAWETVIVPACAVNAWHRRDRVWVVAHAQCAGFPQCERRECLVKEQRAEPPWEDNALHLARTGRSATAIAVMADTEFLGLGSARNERGMGQEGIQEGREGNQLTEGAEECCGASGTGTGARRPLENYWAVEPELGRVAHGIPNRVDRLKCLGNAIVPQVAYEIIRTIKEVETA